jgi:excisionase family DNA binding protein
MPNSEYMTIGDAAEYLDMDRRQVRRLIERGQLTAETNPIDGRSKIVKREDVERLNTYPRPSKKAAAWTDQADGHRQPAAGTNQPQTVSFYVSEKGHRIAP